MIEELKEKLKKGQAIRLTLKVSAGSGRNEIAGFMSNGTLKVKISAPPEKGKANKELVRYLEKIFGVTAKKIHVVRGATSPLKLIEIIP